MIQKIERADDIPLILYWLIQMKVFETVDNIFTAHTNRDGLTYGQLSVLFVAYVIHSLNHRLSGTEEWLINRKTVIERVTGWKLNDKDAADDRLGRLIEVPGKDDGKSSEFQVRTGSRSLPPMNFRPVSADMIRRASMCIIRMIITIMIKAYCSSVTARIADPIFFSINRVPGRLILPVFPS